MKIINPYGLQRPSLDEQLTSEIKFLKLKIGLGASFSENMALDTKKEYLFLLKYYLFMEECLEMVILKGHVFEEEKLTEEKYSSTFVGFSKLPSELRITILEFALAPDLVPKIHCIDERTSQVEKNGATFMSNQPISPLLHVCRESRGLYLFRTKARFAFETYIRFSVDTIYIPDFESREEQFPRFLEHPSAKKIRKLAMRKDFYCEIPGPGSMMEKHFDMLRMLPRWREMTFVFDDNRSRWEVWADRELSFQDLTAKQKRTGPGSAERGYARMSSRYFNIFASEVGLRQIKYRFVLPKEV